MADAGRIDPTSTTGRSCLTVRLRKYAVSSSVLVPCVTTTPAAFGSDEKIVLIRFAIVSQCVTVISVLLTFATCSTLTSATCLISGTPATISSPRSAPDLYSARLVDEAPRPEIVPPVEST